MKSILTLIVLFFSLCGFAQDNYSENDGTTETRFISGFTSLEVSDGIDVYLTASTKETVTVTASEEKYLDKLFTEVEDGTLKIYYGSKNMNAANNEKRKIKAYISYTTLQGIIASGGATVSLENTLETDNLKLVFTGKSLFTGSIEANDIAVTQSAGSGVTISGKASTLSVQSAGGALFKGYDFVADYCNANATGGSVIRITINKELIAKTKTGGGIRYKGDALVKAVDMNSGSAVKKSDD